jgi:hypothetical protein
VVDALLRIRSWHTNDPFLGSFVFSWALLGVLLKHLSATPFGPQHNLGGGILSL